MRSLLLKSLICLTAVLTLSAKDAKAIKETAWPEYYTQYVPAAMALALNPLGASSENTFLGIGISLGYAYIANFTATQTFKHFITEPRPDGSSDNSFPSGHTATAFVGAETVRMNYGWGWGTAAYAVAGYTGTMRIIHDRHYWYDVAGGAVIGIGCAHLGALLAPPLERTIRKVLRLDVRIAVAPGYLTVTF